MITDWIDEVEHEVLGCFCGAGTISPVEVAARLGISERSAVSYICLLASDGRVSIERVVSGPGISAIYRFLLEHRRTNEPEWLGRRLASGEDPNAVITQAGLAGEDPVARETLQRSVTSVPRSPGAGRNETDPVARTW